ncbi:hypothetical protein FGADI_8699 [Fusarium gaditjirri]|uniref:Uncharacterized protein n=1 Tax=Fusarium gaditjirri TaxID=282569 RepID=A0A8H4WTR0_9HYPO|nr:hypothetical protein FGADI_8699 [Fusarium gaditjirri]
MLLNRSQPSLGRPFGQLVTTPAWFADSPVLIDLTVPYIISDSIAFGNGRRPIFSLISAGEVMVFLSKGAAQMFGHLLFILRKKISESLPLSAAARMAGIDKSFVMSYDMPLYIPNPDSTALASYISAITGVGIFAKEADTRQLARETVSSMKARGWQPSAGLAIQYQRPVTPTEAFVPVQDVPDKLKHLGEARKPLMTVNTWQRPQVISASDVRNLSWENYYQIGENFSPRQLSSFLH